MLTLKEVKQNLYLFINVLFIYLYLTLKLNNHSFNNYLINNSMHLIHYLMNLNNCN